MSYEYNLSVELKVMSKFVCQKYLKQTCLLSLKIEAAELYIISMSAKEA